MPDDLDQFEIRTREEEERETEPLVVPPMPAARGRSLFMLSLAIVAVLSLGAIAGLLLILRPWRALLSQHRFHDAAASRERLGRGSATRRQR